MKKVIKANAKINLGLNILEKFPNGYHSLDMIMAPINLHDILEIEYGKGSGELEITTNKIDIPTNKNNILYKIYDAFYEKTGLVKEKISVHLIKKIPHEAGLGGGSSDGGFFLKELNEYHKNILSLEELIELSKKVGADIPFFLINKTCRARGIGENLEIIENNIEEDIVLIKPGFGVSAGEAYNNFSRLKEKKDANIKKIIFGLKENKYFEVLQNIENHLEQALLLTDKKTLEFEQALSSNFKEKFCMSGSGSVYFAIVKKEESQNVLNKLKETFKGYEVFLCKFL